MSELVLCKHDTPDQGRLPLVSSIKEGWWTDFSNAPRFTYADLYNYMIIKPGYDHDGLKAYKDLQGYNFYEAGHVVNLQQVVLKAINYCYVRFLRLAQIVTLNNYILYVNQTTYRVWKKR